MDGKLGSLCTALPINKRTKASGKVLRDTIEDSTPSLGKLVKGVQKASKRGYLRGIDGRKIHMKRDGRGKVIIKDALNRLLQSGAAIIFKKACCILEDKLLSELGNNYRDSVKFLIFYHDETQAFVKDGYIEEYGKLAKEAVKEAGEYFNLNLPLDADIMVGRNWAECH